MSSNQDSLVELPVITLELENDHPACSFVLDKMLSNQGLEIRYSVIRLVRFYDEDRRKQIYRFTLVQGSIK